MPFRNLLNFSLGSGPHQNLEVWVTRGDLVESLHQVDVVVMDSHGKTLEQWGVIDTLMYPRSAIKMMQALAFLESGAVEQFQLGNQEISIACASHYGDAQHFEIVQSWLKKIGFEEGNLLCGPHMPVDEEAKNLLIKQDKKPCRIHNNCSGKHTGMLSYIKVNGLSPQGYNDWDHPLQKTLRRILSELTGIDHDKTPWGVDGCGIPTYAMTLQGLALGLSKFADPSKLPPERARAIQKILTAITLEPHFISGKSGFCSDVIRVSQGRSLVKIGAEGVFAAILPKQGVVFALKVRDGGFRAAEAATAVLLKKYKGLSEDEFNSLSMHTQPVLKNWEGETVGKIIVPQIPLN